MGINLGEIEGIAVGAAGKASSRAREEYQERKRVIAEATSGEEAVTAGITEVAKDKAAAREPGHRLTPLATGNHSTSGTNHAHGSPQEELRYLSPGSLHDDYNIFNGWSY